MTTKPMRTMLLAMGLTLSVAFANPAPAEERLFPTLASVLSAVRFEEPLVPTKATSAVEDSELAAALGQYLAAEASASPEPLEAFVAKFPDSGWVPALETNLGLSALREGYFSRALASWERAWAAGKSAGDGEGKLLVDRAVSELVVLRAKLGQMDQVEQLLNDVGSRDVAGSATEHLQQARELLVASKTDPRHLYLCGPLAVRALMLALGINAEDSDPLRWYRASQQGTNLAELGRLADEVGFDAALVSSGPDEAVPVPSVVHWKVGHFSAIVGEEGGRFHIQDSSFPDEDFWVTREALTEEGSGYFLVPASELPTQAWRVVADTEASGIWGKGPAPNVPPGLSPERDPQCNCEEGGSGPNNPGMPGYNIGETAVSFNLSDSPVGYSPAFGPAVRPQIWYNQREDSQPANFSYFNLSPKWTLSWLSYVIDDPAVPGANVSRVLPSGGAYFYSGYQANTGLFKSQDNDGSRLARASSAPISYRRQLGDGTVEIYAESDGAVAYPRRIFLSQVIDPQGNALSFTYDGQLRLTSVTDATTRVTTLSYGLAARPLLVTKITDPFGRSASFTYDTSFRLKSITDTLGLTTTFTYGANSMVTAMTTPYGTTSFAFTPPGASSPPRFVQVTDPMGFNEREEWLEPAPIPNSDPAGTVPVGMPLTPNNVQMIWRNSFHWDKHQYVAAGCTPSGGCDYSKARLTHFAHAGLSSGTRSTTIESRKEPLENRVWFNYPGQTNAADVGAFDSPAVVARVLDDGTTQLSTVDYDSRAFFRPSRVVDPLGRTTSYAYSGEINLASISQTTQFGDQQLIAQYIYNTKHRPIFYTDAAGQTTRFAYNTAGQLITSTNAKGEVTSYAYNPTGDLMSITNPNGAIQNSFTYDAFARVLTSTDSEGWTVAYTYDAADRIIRATYPDGTKESFRYDRLDLAAYTDRLGRRIAYEYDANRRVTSIENPAGDQMLFGYDQTGNVTSLTDFNTNVTTWAYDLQGRQTLKTFADSTAVAYSYESTISRLSSRFDALAQTTNYVYAIDNRLTDIQYVGAVNPTANVSFAYDPYFPRITSMTDGTGTTAYDYAAVGELGALDLVQEAGPLVASDITYGYDELGRVNLLQVEGTGPQTTAFDALGREITHTNDLGTFDLSYLGETNQIVRRALHGSSLATNWSYLPNVDDRRLLQVENLGFVPGQFSTFDLDSRPGLVTGIVQTSDVVPLVPNAETQAMTFNSVNEIATLDGQPVTFDLNGNLTSDGVRQYEWDAENRLISITYPSDPGRLVEFGYDGLGRRVEIAITPSGGGSATETSYLWCGGEICQARDAGNAIIKGYSIEGEFVPGAPSSTYYYGVDQLGSVRRAFNVGGSAAASDYDPFGNLQQSSGPFTDFGFAALFFEADSELQLANYRAYDSISGRWLSRDPAGEFPAGPMGGSAGNLYSYVHNDPLQFIDPSGLAEWPVPPESIPGGPWTPAGDGYRGGLYFGQKVPRGTMQCQYVPPQSEGGPPGSKGYFKTLTPQEGTWKHYDLQGNPITAQEAHPGLVPPVSRLPSTSPWFVFDFQICLIPQMGCYGGGSS